MKSVTAIAFVAAIVLSAIAFPSNIGAAPARDAGITFKDVEEKEWVLLEVKSAASAVSIDTDMGEVYTISFGENRLSGMGAPNRYNGPYTAGANRSLSIGSIASTMMAAFREPDGLTESEYFNYLSNVTRWDLNEGKLELYSSNSDGTEAVLVFAGK